MHAWTILYNYVWILLKCVDWFNHHFWLLSNFLSSLWCIFANVFPSKPYIITGFQGAHSPHSPCVRTVHGTSLSCHNCNTLATNMDILLSSVRNCGQGNTIWPTAGTPTPNGLRSTWDFLLGRSPNMLVGPTLSTFMALKVGPDDKVCPLILFWTFSYLSWILTLSTFHDVFCMSSLSPSRGSFLISCLNTHMMVKAKWLGLCSYMNSLPCLTRKMDVLTNRPICCFHTHFVNPHIGGCATYRLPMCTHLSTFFISFKIISNILIQNILNTNYYNNRRLLLNHLMIFGSASMFFSFKLREARWSFNISLIDSSIALSHLSIPRRNMSPSLAQHTLVMELHNHRQIRTLSQVIVHHPLIRQIHYWRVMREIRHTN